VTHKRASVLHAVKEQLQQAFNKNVCKLGKKVQLSPFFMTPSGGLTPVLQSEIFSPTSKHSKGYLVLCVCVLFVLL